MTDGTSSPDAQALGAELLAHTLRQVRRSYDELNWSLFRGRLLPPTLMWSEATRVWGMWRRVDRVLSLNPALIDRGWGILVEVLKHEMAHQYVDEIEGAPDEGPHGVTFRRVCQERGIDATAAGEPCRPGEQANSEASPSAEVAVLSKIEGLLALAQSENKFEAEAAMAKARRLMLRYNLSTTGTRAYSFRHLGKPTGRRMAWERALANLLSDFFFVSIIVVPVYRPREKKRGSVIEACGTPTNLEMAAYAYDFLVQTAKSLWQCHKKQRRLTSDRDKQSFLYGVMRGFSDKLGRESQKNQQQGLVWLGDPELDAYFRRRHPHVRNQSGRASVSQDAFSHGQRAGQSIVFHRGVSEGGTSRGPLLLENGSR